MNIKEKKTSMVLAKDRNVDQWTKIEGPEINPYFYDKLIFDKSIQWRQVLSKNSTETTDLHL